MVQLFEAGDVVEVIDEGAQCPGAGDIANSFGLKHFGKGRRCEKGMHGIVRGVQMQGFVQVVGVQAANIEASFVFHNSGLRPVKKGPKDRNVPAALMRQLWISHASSGDVRLLPQGSDGILAHASILEAASPVFAASLQSGMKESHTREIVMQDTDEAVVTGVLQILYTNDMPSDFDMMSALAFVHKYHIAEAARFMAPEILAKVSADTIADVVRFLRDFDGPDDSEQHFLGMIVEKVSGDKKMLAKCLKLL